VSDLGERQQLSLHSFQGRLGLESTADAAKLWLPQLGPGRREVLRLVHELVRPHAVCPILPFPATHPRAPDALIEEYGDLFESVSAPFESAWHVDARDLVYADEKSPLDLYRTILRIDDARKRVFEQTGGSLVILSPLGSKALSLGMFMAAVERDFAVVSVESIGYDPTAAGCSWRLRRSDRMGFDTAASYRGHVRKDGLVSAPSRRKHSRMRQARVIGVRPASWIRSRGAGSEGSVPRAQRS
jgi:hypothetical protein